jgi:hypothetical protein
LIILFLAPAVPIQKQNTKAWHAAWHAAQVGQKIIVHAVLAISGLLRGQGQEFFGKRDMEMEQHGAVKQKIAALAALG